MLQKITWMRYLTLGIISIIMPIGISCETGELPIKTATYIYINNFKSKVFIEAYGLGDYYSRVIQGGDSIVYSSQDEVPFPFSSSLNIPGGNADSVIIRFSDNKCIRYKNFGTLPSEQQLSGGVFNLEEYDNYSKDLVNQRSYTLRYSIDSADYKKATTCK